MDLIQLLRTFRSLSGRYDLTDDDPEKNIVHIINAACKTLDRISETQKSFASYFAFLDVGEFSLSIPYCRAIKEVWAASTTERWQVEKKNLQDIIVNYMSDDTIDSGDSTYYSPVVTRKIPADADLSSFAAYMTYLDTQPNLDANYNGIVIVPPSDTKIMIEVKGLFYSADLVEDDDENYWSAIHPMTLLRAVMRELDIFNQNQTKVEGWNKALTTDLENISKDLVDEVISEVTEIDG